MAYSANEVARLVSERSGFDVSPNWVLRLAREGALPYRAEGWGRASRFTEPDVEKAVALATLRKSGFSGQQVRGIFGRGEEAVVTDDTARRALLFASKVGEIRKRGVDIDTAMARAGDEFASLWDVRNDFVNAPHGTIVEAEQVRVAFHKAEAVLMGDLSADGEACPEAALELLEKAAFIGGAELRKIREVRDASESSDLVAIEKRGQPADWSLVRLHRAGPRGPEEIFDNAMRLRALAALRRGDLAKSIAATFLGAAIDGSGVAWNDFDGALAFAGISPTAPGPSEHEFAKMDSVWPSHIGHREEM